MALPRHQRRHATPGRDRVRLAPRGHGDAERPLPARRHPRVRGTRRGARARAPHRLRRESADSGQMKRCSGTRARGFTLIELMIALLILSIVALMSYRGLVAVLDAREHVAGETAKWRRVASFLAR